MLNHKIILLFALHFSCTISASASSSFTADPFPDLNQLLTSEWSSPATNGQLIETWGMIDATTFEPQTIYLEKKDTLNPTTEPALMEPDLTLPYRQIPDAPEKYNAATVAARMIDGLAFRYYWATEGLRQHDLDYRTTPDSRSSAETIDHIHGLAKMIHNAVMEIPNISGGLAEELSFSEQRTQTLTMLATASERLKNCKSRDLKRFNIIFQRGDNQNILPFWNTLNGPLADAIWHVGQVVAFRRASGNPFNSNVNVLRGTVKE